MRRWAGWAVAALALMAAACSPHVQMPGPAVAEPALNGDHLATADGLRLPLRHWRPEGAPQAVVLALHGFNDYSNSYAEPGPFLSDRGVIVYAYDQRGFGQGPHPGLWAGARAMAADLGQAARMVKARHPELPLYVLGESMGGAVIMLAMTGDDPPPADGVILSAPAVWGRSTMGLLERTALLVAAHTVPWMKLSGRGLKITPSDNIEMLRALSKDPLVIKETRVDAVHGLVDLMDAALAAAPRLACRTLVLYGEKDEIVPPEPTFRVIAALAAQGNGHRAALYENGYHMLMRDLQAAVVLEDIASWITAPDAPLPSGADARAREALAERSRASR